MALSSLDPDQQDANLNINPRWFVARRIQYSDPKGNKILDGFLDEEIAALQSLYEGNNNAEDTAIRITNPISTSPVPFLGTYSDESVATIRLWHIVVDALISWPSVRVPELLALLRAIGRLPGSIHNSEAMGSETETQLTWSMFPYFSFAWFEVQDRWPGELVRRAQGDARALESFRRDYIRRKDVEAQLLASRILKLDDGFVEVHIAKAFEQKPDVQIATDDAAAYEQNRIEFQVPAIASLMTHACKFIFDIVVGKERGLQRWKLWEQRLEEIEKEHHDDLTKEAAKIARDKMHNTRCSDGVFP